ncbi:PREDICTED: uncharacterized protein LOC108747353 [Trachymyrmex septentrionalis]|nr:PREDICTED: uncharacterized protein LOC108747353 [Trachymyrmex septentrionalis]XP_018340263.1 PREDICTED: uncharacterized protein LOC108747353 [Trachymyrmex septentrionalis]XP_018340264.1 PREDICTED: uncharacterized protein LOC108747353 [Trachymyrmex septentrionalis]XP_018340265.1 PREDICTED: uncharacterized protein LOC108747353 [Trachymyrmex septentrionalis]XP_018340266.1 PREDICTED: uncharacterized protein LOC108747353 [Trachymyrmex septentrionalis]XP_018340267.1 PREDICTED: uncharacterized pro
MAKLHELNFELLPHPPYSPDLAPSDYWLFADLKKMLAEILGHILEPDLASDEENYDEIILELFILFTVNDEDGQILEPVLGAVQRAHRVKILNYTTPIGLYKKILYKSESAILANLSFDTVLDSCRTTESLTSLIAVR